MGADTKKQPRATVNLLDGLGVALRDAILITLIASGVGAGINLVHPERIPFVARQHYQTLVPCPEPGGEVTALSSPEDTAEAMGRLLTDPEKHRSCCEAMSERVRRYYNKKDLDRSYNDLYQRLLRGSTLHLESVI